MLQGAYVVLVCIGVINGRERVGILCPSAWLNSRSHPITLVWLSGSLDENIKTLSNTERNGLVGSFDHGNEICRNNIHCMAVDREVLHSLCASINNTKTMNFAGLEIEFGNTRFAITRIRSIE